MKPRLHKRSSNAYRALALGICLGLPGLLTGASPWRIYWNGQDTTDVAEPRGGGRSPSVNASALAPLMMLSVEVQGGDVLIRDPEGLVWRSAHNDVILEGPGRRIALDGPVRVEGSSVYVSIEALAEITGRRLEVDFDSRVALLGSALRTTGAVGDWEAFELQKTSDEQAEYRRIYGGADPTRDNPAANLEFPRGRDTLRVRLGQGYVGGLDSGTDLTGSGRLYGIDTDFGLQLTAGRRGFEVLTGRFAMLDADRGLGFEAGDLFSDLYGLARGVRFSWAKREKHRPALSLYFDSSRGGVDQTVFTFGDEYRVSESLAVGGEVASDGSLFVKSRFRKGNVGVSSYLRHSESQAIGSGHGLFASYGFARGISLDAGFTHSETGIALQDKRDTQIVSLRIPVVKRIDLTLARTFTQDDLQEFAANSATVSFGVGRFRAFYRFQLRDSERFLDTPGAGSFFLTQRESLASASFLPNRRVSLDFQIASRWQQDGRVSQWEQLAGRYELTEKTRLEAVTAFPNLLDPDQMRLRLVRQLTKKFDVAVEYGRISPYQSTSFERTERLFKISLRRLWEVKTPARGGSIRGRVEDQLGRPLPSVVVKVGRYGAVTDDEGRYEIKHLPEDDYEVYVDEASLPADYSWDGVKRRYAGGRGNDAEMDFVIAPLNTIQGVVYVDKNKDGKRQDGEAALGAVLRLNDHATASDESGRFAFYNLTPGSYTVRLDESKLGGKYTLLSPPEVEVQLQADHSGPTAEFRIVEREKAVEFQELDE